MLKKKMGRRQEQDQWEVGERRLEGKKRLCQFIRGTRLREK